MKKVFSTIIALVLVFTVFSCAAFADGGFQIVVGTAEAAKGENVSLIVRFANNPGIAIASGKITYDDTALTLLSINGLISGTWSVDSAAEDHMFMWANIEGNSSNDSFMKLNFKVADNAAPKDYEVGIYADPAWDGVYTKDEILVETSYVSGKVTVKEESLAITEQPTNQTGAMGAKVSFTVKASGDGLKYQWQYSTDGTTWTTSGLAGCKTDTLTVPVVEERRGHVYRCKVTDSSGVKIYSDTVTVIVG